MYEVIFYTDVHGVSPVKELILDLDARAPSNKDARVQLKQIYFQLNLLEEIGTYSSEDITKHLQEGIWELRPGKNRILFALWKENKFIVLSHFRKKGQKTPVKEIEKAKRNLEDWIKQHGQ